MVSFRGRDTPFSVADLTVRGADYYAFSGVIVRASISFLKACLMILLM